MALDLKTLTSGMFSRVLLNKNFDDIENKVNNDLVHRQNGSAQMEQDLDMNSNEILNMGEPTADSSVATKGYVDTQDTYYENLSQTRDAVLQSNIDANTASINSIEVSGIARVESEEFVATAGQTTFTLTTAGFAGDDTLSVYVNGVRQYSDAYTTPTNTSVEFTESLQEGDKVLLVVNESPASTIVAEQVAGLNVHTLENLLGVSPSDSTVVNVLNYHSDVEGGGGVFYWDATKAKSEHNGGTIIDPTATFPTDWSVTAQQETWFDASNTGTGCWVRQFDGAVNVKWFGSKGDGVSDDTKPLGILESLFSSVLIEGDLINSSQTDFNSSVLVVDDTKLTDTATGEAFNLVKKTKHSSLSQAFLDVQRLKKSGAVPKIVCYGDSNTRYYEGDEATGAGPLAKSYGAWIDYLCTFEPSLYGATVDIKGYPGERASYGDLNFSSNVPSDTDIVVIGFGTNDVKLSGADSDNYLASIESILVKALMNKTVPIVLGLPWYSETYGSDNQLSQDRLKTWNSRLYSLCLDVGAFYIDTYNLTSTYPSVYFNENLVQRHYSSIATRAIASKIVSLISQEIMTNGGQVPAFSDRGSFDNLSLIASTTGTLTRTPYRVGGVTFNTLKIPSGTTVTIIGAGRGALSFYPRASAEARVTTPYETKVVPISNTLDKTYYRVKRVSLGHSHEDKSAYNLTIEAVGGDLFLSGISFLDSFQPVNYTQTIQHVSAQSLPEVGVRGQKFYITELKREVYWDGAWIGAEGLYAVGDTSARNAVSSSTCYVGLKFYNTDTSTMERWTGSTWV